MNFLVDLNLSWKKLVLSSKDFVALAEIIDRATIVDQIYVSKHDSYALVIDEQRGVVTAEKIRYPIMTQDQFDEMNVLALEPKSEVAA